MKRVAIPLALAMIAQPMVARAGDDQCAEAYEHGQELRLAKKLAAARDLFLVCARPTCPQVARDDCSKWLGEVEGSLAGVIVHATRAATAFDDARVVIDGTTAVERIDSRPITIDPGTHVIRIEPHDCAPHEKEMTFTAGDPLRVDFEVCAEKPIVSAGIKTTTTTTTHVPIATFVLGGVGLAALGTFIGFAAVGISDANTLTAPGGCYPHCQQGPVDKANNELLVADVSLGVAIASFAVATIWFLVTRRTF